MDTKYLPSAILSNSNLPVLSATLIFATDESFTRNNEIVADSMVLVLPSMTVPLIFPCTIFSLAGLFVNCAWLTKDKVKTTVSKVKIFFMCEILLVWSLFELLVLVLNYYSSKLGTMLYKEH